MKKASLLLITGLLLILLTSCAEKEPDYIDIDVGYSITLPKGWEIFEGGNRAAIFSSPHKILKEKDINDESLEGIIMRFIINSWDLSLKDAANDLSTYSYNTKLGDLFGTIPSDAAVREYNPEPTDYEHVQVDVKHSKELTIKGQDFVGSTVEYSPLDTNGEPIKTLIQHTIATLHTGLIISLESSQYTDGSGSDYTLDDLIKIAEGIEFF